MGGGGGQVREIVGYTESGGGREGGGQGKGGGAQKEKPHTSTR